MPVEADTLAIMMQSDNNVTPHKRIKMDPKMPSRQRIQVPIIST